jgi:hypothetical protein
MARSKAKSELAMQPPVPVTAINEVQALQAEVVRLQSELEGARLRADADDEMINVAESNFKITIRKKAGAKR